MKTITSSRELKEELAKLKTIDKMQDALLFARIREIEVSLEPKNLARKGIRMLFEKDETGAGLLPALAGAGVEAALQSFLSRRSGFLGGIIGRLLGNTLETGRLGDALKTLLSSSGKSRENKEEAAGKKQNAGSDEVQLWI